MPYIGNPIYQSAFVTDTFSGNGTTTAFTMSVAPAGTTNVLVAISGVLQDPSTYGVVGTTITFSTAPPSGTGNISCRYLGIPVTGVTTTAYRTVTEFTATAGQTTFVPPSYEIGFINVYRNGVLLGSADYAANNGVTVVLTTGATAGDLVTVESFLVSSVLNALPNIANVISSAYIVENAVTTEKIADGSVTQTKLATGVAGTGPAFSAYLSTNQSISNVTFTKVQCNTEEFDTNSNYDNSTNYRFTPTVAGYYMVTGATQGAGATTNYETLISIYKNGSEFKRGGYVGISAGSGTSSHVVASALIYFNGTTDYVELYAYYGWGGGAGALSGTNYNTYFQASMVRAA